jgi:hypothetical protein
MNAQHTPIGLGFILRIGAIFVFALAALFFFGVGSVSLADTFGLIACGLAAWCLSSLVP